jgi:enoyl-CoA hydratase
MDFATYTTMRFERRGRVLHAEFNRPDALNAIDHVTHKDLARLFSEVAADEQTNVLVLSGAGKAFSAGGDLDYIQQLIDSPKAFFDDIGDIKKIVFSILDCPKPIIAKLHGHAIGLGATIALFCDIVMAAPGIKIADPHVKLGFTAGDGGAVIWPHLIGHARAKEFLMTGRPISSEDAERMGLINRVVAREELDKAVNELADELSNGPSRAIQWTKMSINIGLRQHAHAVMDASAAYEALSNVTGDHREAVLALREKRPPVFTGN